MEAERDELVAETEAALRYCLRLLGDRHDAEDAAQDALLRMIQQPRGSITNPVRWLARAATYTCAELSRTRVRREVVQRACVRLHPSEPHINPEDRAVEAVLAGSVMGAVAGADGALLVQLYMEDRPVDEVAVRLRVTPNCVRVRALRARNRARAALVRSESGDAGLDDPCGDLCP